MTGRYLYKAKRVDNGEWVEGFYYKMDETTYCFTEDYEKQIQTHHYILFEQMTDWGLPNRMCQVKIDPSTLCQCTGLKDKSGKLIWENDIVMLNQMGFAQRDIYAKVEFNDGCFDLKGIRWRDYLKCYVVNHAVEVIVNIFDNPELLDVEEC